MGKAKKLGIGVGIVILSFFLLVIIGAASSDPRELQEGNEATEIKKDPHVGLSQEEYEATEIKKDPHVGLSQEEYEATEIKKDPHVGLSQEEYEELAIPWSYSDIVRNPEKYYGEILSVDGNVEHTLKISGDQYYLAIKKQCGDFPRNLICDYAVVDYSGKRILTGDNIQSYGKLTEINEYWPNLQPTPVIKSYFLECLNCN